jgi:nucleoid DNA-binding protein
MDVDLLAKMLGELVLDHDEVGLPGLGTFVAETVPASFSDRGYTINPPYRRLSFHPGRGEDDLLVDLYASGNNVEKEVSRSILASFLTEMKEVLKSNKTIILPGLGRLRATKENNFFFVCDENLDIYPEGYGLKPISLKTHSGAQIGGAPVSAGLASIVTAMQAAAAPEADRAPETGPVAVQTSGDELEAARTPEAGSAPASEVVPGSESPVEPEPAIMPAAEPEPEATAEPAAAPAAVTAAAPEPAAESASAPRRKSRLWRIVALSVLSVVVLAAVALAVFLILAKVAPDFIDSLLYTPEELRILNY